VSTDEGRRCWSKDTLALAPWVPVLSRCHPSRRPFESANPETAAGDVLPVHDPGPFAIDPHLFHVVAATVAGDLEDFVHQAFRLAFSCPNAIGSDRIESENTPPTWSGIHFAHLCILSCTMPLVGHPG
jgi:hypothetical protein